MAHAVEAEFDFSQGLECLKSNIPLAADSEASIRNAIWLTV